MPTRRSLVVLAATITLVAAAPARAQDKSIVVASTTSTQDSGLFGHILPLFKAKTGIDVKVVAQGTGKALDTARRGDADVVFVHAREAEEKFIAEGDVQPHNPHRARFAKLWPNRACLRRYRRSLRDTNSVRRGQRRDVGRRGVHHRAG